MPKFIMIVERVENSSDIWGRIHYGEDLLTAVGSTLPQLLSNFKEQLEGFYNLQPAKMKFEIQ